MQRSPTQTGRTYVHLLSKIGRKFLKFYILFFFLGEFGAMQQKYQSNCNHDVAAAGWIRCHCCCWRRQCTWPLFNSLSFAFFHLPRPAPSDWSTATTRMRKKCLNIDLEEKQITRNLTVGSEDSGETPPHPSRWVGKGPTILASDQREAKGRQHKTQR